MSLAEKLIQAIDWSSYRLDSTDARVLCSDLRRLLNCRTQVRVALRRRFWSCWIRAGNCECG